MPDAAPFPLRPRLLLLAVLLLAGLAGAAILALAYARFDQRAETSRLGLAVLERLTLANRHLEISHLWLQAGLIESRHLPTGRELVFSTRDVLAGRTAVGVEEYPVASAPGWRAAPWVPVYSSAQVESFRYRADEGHQTGEIRLLSATPVTALAGFYEDALRREGLSVIAGLGTDGVWAAQARAPGRQAQVAVRLVPQPRGSRILIEYAGR